MVPLPLGDWGEMLPEALGPPSETRMAACYLKTGQGECNVRYTWKPFVGTPAKQPRPILPGIRYWFCQDGKASLCSRDGPRRLSHGAPSGIDREAKRFAYLAKREPAGCSHVRPSWAISTSAASGPQVPEA